MNKLELQHLMLAITAPCLLGQNIKISYRDQGGKNFGYTCYYEFELSFEQEIHLKQSGFDCTYLEEVNSTIINVQDAFTQQVRKFAKNTNQSTTDTTTTDHE